MKEDVTESFYDVGLLIVSQSTRIDFEIAGITENNLLSISILQD